MARAKPLFAKGDTEKTTPVGFFCRCGVAYTFPDNIHARWNQRQKGSCRDEKCGALWETFQGRVKVFKKGKVYRRVRR